MNWKLARNKYYFTSFIHDDLKLYGGNETKTMEFINLVEVRSLHTKLSSGIPILTNAEPCAYWTGNYNFNLFFHQMLHDVNISYIWFNFQNWKVGLITTIWSTVSSMKILMKPLQCEVVNIIISNSPISTHSRSCTKVIFSDPWIIYLINILRNYIFDNFMNLKYNK